MATVASFFPHLTLFRGLAEQAEKRKQDDADAEMEPESFEEKKVKNPLDDLPKSAMVLDAWKREYSNAPGGDCTKAMPWFWENFDAQGEW